jgi:hypothetical protein
LTQEENNETLVHIIKRKKAQVKVIFRGKVKRMCQTLDSSGIVNKMVAEEFLPNI